MSRPGGPYDLGPREAGISAVGVRELFWKARLPGVTMGAVFSGGEAYLWQYTPDQLPGRVTRR
jgi:hypothetical protein